MALKLPYGLRDVKLYAITYPAGVETVSSTGVDLPASRTLGFSDTEEFQELRGDDKVQASRGSGPVVEWSLEAGGIDLAAYAIMSGGSVTTSGVTPNTKKTYSKLGADSRPYFKIEGQSISDNGGDLHAVIYKCKADGSLEGEFTDGEFFVTSASGKGYPNATDKSYDFVDNETVTAIT